MENITIHVPASAIDAYNATSPWMGFHIVALTDEETTEIKSELNPSSDISDVYNIHGRRIDAPQKGLSIIRMSDGTVRKVVMK